MTLHVFNPSHDEALAAGRSNYTPSLAARRMEAELWDFPRLWGRTDDDAWDYSPRTAWAEVERIAPWGWDALLVRRLRRAGAPESLLPTAAQLEAVRRLSARSTAVGLLPRLRAAVADTIGQSTLCATPGELSATLGTPRADGYVAKAPWSCSGRGVFRISGEADAAAWQRAQGILRRQGSIAVEPYYAHEADFAMEFSYDGRAAHFAGLSLFITSAAGGYMGNIVASDEAIAHRLAAIVPSPEAFRATLLAVRAALERLLPAALGADYAGPVGIDMMLSGGRVPCVEINLRRTMGLVAIELRRKCQQPSLFRLTEKDGKLAAECVPFHK